MASPERKTLARIRAEVIPLVAAIPKGRFTTYGSLARHLGVNPRLVAAVLARLDEREAEILPWHRVVAAEGRISRGMAESIRIEQALRERTARGAAEPPLRAVQQWRAARRL